MSIFTLLFGNDSNKDDGWKQPQREALIDLLSLAMYADSHLSINEQAAIDSQVKKLYWDSSLSIEAFSNSAINRARDARNNEAIKTDYLQDISDKLGDAATKTKAYEITRSVLASDGHEDREALFLRNLKNVFEI